MSILIRNSYKQNSNKTVKRFRPYVWPPGSRKFWTPWRHTCTSWRRPDCRRGWLALSCVRQQSCHTSWTCGSLFLLWTIVPLHPLWKLHTPAWRWLLPPLSGPPEASWTPPAALNGPKKQILSTDRPGNIPEAPIQSVELTRRRMSVSVSPLTVSWAWVSKSLAVSLTSPASDSFTSLIVRVWVRPATRVFTCRDKKQHKTQNRQRRSCDLITDICLKWHDVTLWSYIQC